MNSSIIVPITLWSGSGPSFRVSSISVSPNLKNLITGSWTGQLCLWNLNVAKKKIYPKNILIGHENSVSCMVSTNEFVISCSESGEMCRWHLEDGFCEIAKNSLHIHKNIQLYKANKNTDDLVFTCGDYSEIFIYQSFTLQKISCLFSESNGCWITNFHVISSENKENMIVAGITAKGCLKLWTVDDSINKLHQEIQSNNLPIENVIDLKYNFNRKNLLIVTIKYWCIFDSEYFNCLYKINNIVDNEKLLGGNYCNSNIVIWTDCGKFYIYSENNNTRPHLKTVFLDDFYLKTLFNPAMTVLENKNREIYFFRGDSYGQINIWTYSSFDNVSNFSSVKPVLSTALSDNWSTVKKGFFDNIASCSSCLEGNILILPAVQSMMSYSFYSFDKPSYNILSGHKGKVNCLIHPHSKYSHYDKAHVVSGSSDFSVCLWDVFKLELLHRFCVQSGEILRLIIPPVTCSPKIKQSICSISSDHSVAILNLTDKRCVILTSSHMFPVVTINWKPLDGFLIVECFDGTVFVWETETGILDRVLNGVIAQEVIFACNEKNICNPPAALFNFYTDDGGVKRKNSLRRDFYEITGDNVETSSTCLFKMNGFLTSKKSESHVFLCNIDNLFTKIISDQNTHNERRVENCCDDDDAKLYLLTQMLNPDSTKNNASKPLENIKSDDALILNQNGSKSFDNNNKMMSVIKYDGETGNDENDCLLSLNSMFKILRFVLSSFHVWDLDPLFLSNCKSVYQLSSSVLATTCLIMTALSSLLKSISLVKISNGQEGDKEENDDDTWEKLYEFYEHVCMNVDNGYNVTKPRIDVLVRGWCSSSYHIRKVSRKLLPIYLSSLLQKEDHVDLLKFWFKYLPHFKFSSKTKIPDKDDLDDVNHSIVALILFGSENYVYQTCASFVYLLLMSNNDRQCFNELRDIAIDFIGRGYILWEQFLKMEKILPVFFEICTNMLKNSYEFNNRPFGICLTAHDALKAIALARTSAFIKCLTTEMTRMKPSSGNKNGGGGGGDDNFAIENSKAEILSVIVFLLEKTPYIMLLYLNEVISIFVYCIDLSHFKRENLSDMIPIMKKFRQVHHCLNGQKIAVGLSTGSIVIHDLKSKKILSATAHKDSISAIKFSDDGKHVASYSFYENRLTLWQVLTGIFGLGQIQIKMLKSFETYRIHDEEIKNHFEIAQLIWIDNKSISLSLCDGTETIFHM
ncbi:tgf-beta resistance-associated protein trag, putative [Pediculus humanus corporis]|uniref:Tgf-beta resistance-associated protein trag, putative n=1 Tax=Pediculus humanus subsp. corporis TaxID=121224 RepID=E0VLK8_PEDHC|nr:tgf-beta resistance-associated protein trag, putative [Pediculus humanus corporis]EEB14264.1 tgf-beta resistance-associated protein trag, putative [Pediculus humanus corporis]